MTEINSERSARLNEFLDAMKEKLNQPRNVAKQDWRKLDLNVLRELLNGEVGELLEAWPERAIIGEAVDVANFAFMIWDVAMRDIEKYRGEPA